MLRCCHVRCRVVFVLLAAIVAAVASTRFGEFGSFTSPDGAELFGGTICTTIYKEYDCSDCINDYECGQTQSLACKSYTGSICIECMTQNAGNCPGPLTKFVPGTNPPCDWAYAVWYPNCTTRDYAIGTTVGCDGACS